MQLHGLGNTPSRPQRAAARPWPTCALGQGLQAPKNDPGHTPPAPTPTPAPRPRTAVEHLSKRLIFLHDTQNLATNDAFLFI